MNVKNENLISEKDFEFYRIPIPWKIVNLGFLKQERRNVFVKGELEKMHPGFSDKDCTDIKFSFKKRKLVAEVAVMNRMKLAQYKTAAGSKMLLISGKSPRTRIAFSARPKKKKSFIFLVSGILLGVIFIGFSISGHKNQIPEIEEITEMHKENIFEKTAEILNSVETEGGIIKYFKAENGTIEFKIERCWPENIFSNEFCAVSYENGIPKFSIATKAYFLQDQSNSLAGSSFSKDFISQIRKSVMELHGKIETEEQFSDFSKIVFTAAEDNISKIFSAIRKYEIERGWRESDFTISAENGIFSIEMGFEPGFLKDSFCTIFSGCLQLFEKKQEHSIEKEHGLVSRQNQIASVSELVPPKKVGQITGVNGQNVIFLRTPEGKIIRKEGVYEKNN